MVLFGHLLLVKPVNTCVLNNVDTWSLAPLLPTVGATSMLKGLEGNENPFWNCVSKVEAFTKGSVILPTSKFKDDLKATDLVLLGISSMGIAPFSNFFAFAYLSFNNDIFLFLGNGFYRFFFRWLRTFSRIRTFLVFHVCRHYSTRASRCFIKLAFVVRKHTFDVPFFLINQFSIIEIFYFIIRLDWVR